LNEGCEASCVLNKHTSGEKADKHCTFPSTTAHCSTLASLTRIHMCTHLHELTAVLYCQQWDKANVVPDPDRLILNHQQNISATSSRKIVSIISLHLYGQFSKSLNKR